MIDPQEIVPVLMAAIILWVGWYSRFRRDGRVAFRLLVGAFLMLVTGWTATVVEELVYEDVFNAVEHAARMLAAVLVAAACWRLAGGAGRDDR